MRVSCQHPSSCLGKVWCVSCEGWFLLGLAAAWGYFLYVLTLYLLMGCRLFPPDDPWSELVIAVIT